MEIVKPTFFYKYYKLNDYFFESIRDGKLWFSHQKNLNDPYDCKYSFSETYLQELLVSACNAMLSDLREKSDYYKYISEERFFEIMKPELYKDEWLNSFYNMQFNGGLGWCTCCFSTDFQNELMWAHYADSNKGICLEFDLTSTSDLYEKIHPVKYDDTFPIINCMDELPDALLRKRSAWQYEKEWRILSNIEGYKTYNKDSLKTIYFGCNVNTGSIDEIRTLLYNSGYIKVDFKQINFYINKVKFTHLDSHKF